MSDHTKVNFKITFILFIWIFFNSLSINAQNEEKEQVGFIKYFGTTGISRGVTVEEVVNGGYILTGYTTDGKYGGEDVFLIRTDAKGNIIWRKTYGGKGNDNGWAVRQTDDGGFIILGFTDSFGNGGMDVYLVKTDPEGDVIWTKTFGSEKDEFGWDIRTTQDNGFIIAAQTNGYGNGDIDAYLIKTDSLGIEEWSNTFGGKKVDRIFSVQPTHDGGFIAGGITYSYDNVGPNDRDGYLIKTDFSGKQEWYKTFGKNNYDVVHSVDLTNDGGFILTGYGESFSTSKNNRDVYLIKTDSNGKHERIKTYGGLDEERGIKGLQTENGDFVVIGFTKEGNNLYLLKTNINGEKLWTRTYGENDKMDFGYTVKETSDGGLILIGHSESLENGQASVLLIKTDEQGLVR